MEKTKRVTIKLEKNSWDEDGNYHGSITNKIKVTLLAVADGYAMVRKNKGSEPFIVCVKRIVKNGN